jgi:hypothetical protein
MLKASMQEFGDLSGIVVNIRTGQLCGGHQRVKNLNPSWEIKKKAHKDKVGTVAIGYIETPYGQWQYREVDWNEQKEKAANVAANKHGGDFELNKLSEILQELENNYYNHNLLGFNQNEFNKLLAYVSIDQDEAIEIAEELMDSNQKDREQGINLSIIQCPFCGKEFEK